MGACSDSDRHGDGIQVMHIYPAREKKKSDDIREDKVCSWLLIGLTAPRVN